MRWITAVSRSRERDAAIAEVAEAVRSGLEGARPDLVLAFFTSDWALIEAGLRDGLAESLSPRHLAGVSAAGVIAGEEEIERGPALVLAAATLGPGARVEPFLLSDSRGPAAEGEAADFEREAPGALGAELLLLLADPFTVDADATLATFWRHAPELRIAGGMASAGRQPGENLLFLNDWVGREGGMGLAFRGELRVDTAVSQGCRALGPGLEVTAADGNVLLELDGRPALERLQEVLEGLPQDERRLLRQGVLVGRPVRSDAEGRGDYLIRNFVGQDPATGAIAIGDHMQAGDRLRLHVRDAETAREDLGLVLAPQAFDTRARGALLFTCNGRGRNLFPEPHTDVSILQRALDGPVPVAGMFCAGEIGAIGERNHLHGHTASVAVFRDREPARDD